jgi:outer membrane protein
MRQLQFGICFIFIFSSLVFAEEIRLGVVDLERAINEVDEGARAKADLKKEFEAKQAILDKKQEEAKKMQESYEGQASIMSPAVKQERGMELQRKIADVQQLYVSMQQEMAKRQQDAMGGILQKMGVVLNALRVEGDYTMILNKNETAVLAVKPHLDLTNEVIRRYNKDHAVKKGSVKKK